MQEKWRARKARGTCHIPRISIFKSFPLCNGYKAWRYDSLYLFNESQSS